MQHKEGEKNEEREVTDKTREWEEKQGGDLKCDGKHGGTRLRIQARRRLSELIEKDLAPSGKGTRITAKKRGDWKNFKRKKKHSFRVGDAG